MALGDHLLSITGLISYSECLVVDCDCDCDIIFYRITHDFRLTVVTLRVSASIQSLKVHALERDFNVAVIDCASDSNVSKTQRLTAQNC